MVQMVWAKWDTDSGSIPFDSVVHGKNELTVELQGPGSVCP